MPDMNAPLKLGANLWNQYTDWPAFLDAMLRAEDLGFDSLFTWDHVYPIVGSWEGPALETYTAMAAVAAQTKRATIGHLVSANTFRNPALLAKMITTIDHISGGRAVLGIGAAWMEPEHTAFGIEFGDRPGTRLRWLEQSLQIIRGMLDGDRPSSPEGSRYAVDRVRNRPHRCSGAIPILIGGSGPKVTLRLVAKYADMNNLGNPIEPLLDVGVDPRGALPHGRPGREVASSARSSCSAWSSATRARRPWRARPSCWPTTAAPVDDEGGPGSAGVGSDRIMAGNPDEVDRAAEALRRGRLSPPHLRLPAALRRGDDAAHGDRGPAATGGARSRLT